MASEASEMPVCHRVTSGVKEFAEAAYTMIKEVVFTLSLTLTVIFEYPTAAGVILRFREAPLPVRLILALGTTVVLVLVAVTISAFTGVTSSPIVKSMPDNLAGSVGSLITPLTAKGLAGGVLVPPSRKLEVVATLMAMVGAPF